MTSLKARVPFYSYRLLARFAEILPGKAVVPVARVAGRVAMRFSKRQKEVVANNLAHVLERRPTEQELQAAFCSYTRYWLDALRSPVYTAERLNEICLETGLSNIRAARERGKGVIIALPHLGNWDVAGAWLVQQDVPLTVVVEQLEPPELFQWFRDFRQSLGITVVVNGPRVGVQLSAALRRNEAIALLCDRDVDGTGVETLFFGEKTKLPKGPAILAKRTGAALLPTAVFEEGAGYRAVMGEPVSIDHDADNAIEIPRVTEELTRRIEDLIRRAPTQWHVFQPNWPSTGA